MRKITQEDLGQALSLHGQCLLEGKGQRLDMPQGMRMGESLGYLWVLYADGRFKFGCETHLVSAWLEGGLAEVLSRIWTSSRWKEYATEIRRILLSEENQ